EALEHLLRALTVLAPFQVVPEPDELEVLAAGEKLVDGGVLSREPNHRAERGGVGDDVVARYSSATSIWPEECRQDPDERRLPRTVRAEQRQHFALGDEEVDLGECLRLPEALRDPLHLDHRHTRDLNASLSVRYGTVS